MFKMRNLLLLLGLLLVALPVLAQSSTPEATPSEQFTLNLSSSDTLGQFIIGPNGMTVYAFDVDSFDKSNCNGKCAEFWPPLTVNSASDVTNDQSIPGAVGTITRDDGTIQVTYNGWPLYYWSKDKVPGNTTGQGVTKNWWIVPPATAAISKNDTLGRILVGANGMTVYMFKNDTAGSGASTCTGQCATNWPALTVAAAADVVKGQNLPGTWDTITRDDGTIQVTYDGWPLYYFAKDAKVGDTMGQGVGNKWYVVAPETVVAANNATVGSNVLTAPSGFTLYTFKNDSSGTSTCTGDCASNWPAFTVGANDQLVAGTGVSGTLATITRDDGSLQVTYNGMSLYYFKNDAKPGDAAGQGAGNVWFAATP